MLPDDDDPPGAPPRSRYDDFFDEQDRRQERRVRASLIQTTDTSPDRAAEARRLAIRMGAPVAMVDANLEAFRQRDQAERVPAARLATESPHLAGFLGQSPNNAALVKDDLEPLGLLEWLVTAPQRAAAQGFNQITYGRLRHQSLFRDLTQEERDQMNSAQLHMQAGGQLGAGDSWFRKAVTGASQQLPILLGAGWGAATRGVQAAAAGAVAGAAVGATAGGPLGLGLGMAAGIGGGLTVGALAGGAEFSYELESGLAYDEFLSFRDEHGLPLDPSAAKGAALAAGVINAGLETAGGFVLARTFKALGLERLSSAGVRSIIKQALRTPTVRGAVTDMVKSYGGALTAEVSTEIAQRAVTLIAGEMAKGEGGKAAVPGLTQAGTINLYEQPVVQNPDGSISTVDSLSVGLPEGEVLLPTVTADGRHFTGTPEQVQDAAIAEYRKTGRHLGIFKDPATATVFAQQLHEDYAAGYYGGSGYFKTKWQIATDLAQEGVGALQAMALTVLPGPLISVQADIRHAKRAEQSQQWFQALAEGVTQSKTVQRMPDAAQQLLAQATKDGPLEHSYAPTDSFAQYWTDQGVDPRAMATELTGDADAWDRAIRLQEDLQIPTARYAVKLAGTEHHRFFSRELRLGDPDAWNGREVEAYVAAEAAKPTPTPAEPTAGDRLEAALLDKLVRGGRYTAAQAAPIATLWRQTYEQAAAETGRQLEDVVQQEGLREVVRPDLPRPVEQVVAEAATAEVPSEAPAAPGAAPARADAEGAAAPTPAQGDQPAATATFLGYGPSGPLYNIAGGPHDRSTVSAAKLTELGIAVPETPADTGERVTGAQLRAAALAARAAQQAGVPSVAILARIVDAAPEADIAAEVAITQAATRDQPIDLRDPVAAAKLMMAEDPQILAKAKALGERARATRQPAPPRAATGGTRAAEVAEIEGRPVVSDRAGEQPAAGEGGAVEGAGAGPGAESRRVSPPLRGIPVDEVFERRSPEENAARLTPAVLAEIDRLFDELDVFRYEARTWNWLKPGQRVGDVEGAGGHAEIKAGAAGAPVYDDVIAFSPVNRYRGQPAKSAHGSRADVRLAAQIILDTGDIATNLAEGIVRVAEHRAAGETRDLSPRWLPPPTGVEASVSFTNALQEDLDRLVDEGSDAVEPEGPVDLSFDEAIDDLMQGLFDLEPEDTLETGEKQPRLPGAGAARKVGKAATTFRAPVQATSEDFALTAPGAPAETEDDQGELFQRMPPEVEGYEAINPYVAPDERERITARHAEAVVEAFLGLPKDLDFEQVALAGAAARGWYRRATKAIYQVFGPVDGARFTGLLSALSPRVKVAENLENAILMWNAWVQAGRPTDESTITTIMNKAVRRGAGVLPSWGNNVIRALQVEDPHDLVLSGPKVHSFARNLKGYQDEVTNDIWMAIFANLDQSLFGGNINAAGTFSGRSAFYTAMAAKVRRVAERLTARTGETWTPAEVQETIWSWVMTLYQLANTGDQTAEEIVRRGQLTDAQIRNAPQFTDLLVTNAEIRAIFEAGGYGDALTAVEEEFTRPADAGERAAPGGRAAAPRKAATVGLLRSAQRVDVFRQQRAAARDTSDELYQLEDGPKPPFYSRLVRAVETSKQGKAPGAQWKAAIRNAKGGIAKDEFAITRVEDLEDARSYTKAEVLDYLAANTLRVETVRLGVPSYTPAQLAQRAGELFEAEVNARIEAREERDEVPTFDASVEAVETEDGFEVYLDDDATGDVYTTREQALERGYSLADQRETELRREWIEDISNEIDYDDMERQAEEEFDESGTAVQFAQYVEPGLEEGSYQEVFLSVPHLPQLARDPVISYQYVAPSSLYPGQVNIEPRINGHPLPLPDGGRYVTVPADASEAEVTDAIRRAYGDVLSQGMPLRWWDGHNDYDHIENPIVRVRLGVRQTVDSQRVLFLEEVQPPSEANQRHMPPLLIKHWRELGFKWALQEAAARGLAGVAWTTGDQQRDRYRLSTQVRKLEWVPAPAGSVAEATAFVTMDTGAGLIRFNIDATGTVLQSDASQLAQQFIGKPLKDLVGPELAGTIQGEARGALEGQQIDIGGLGLKRLYDVDFRNVVQGLPTVKQHGGRVEVAALKRGDPDAVYRIEERSEFLTAGERTPAQEAAVAAIDAQMDALLGEPGFTTADPRYLALAKQREVAAASQQFVVIKHVPGVLEQRVGGFRTREAAEAELTAQQQAEQPYLALTPPMRQALLAGQALFQEDQPPGVPPAGWEKIEAGPEPANLPPGPQARGSYNRTHRIITLFQTANPSTILHETGHHFLELWTNLAVEAGASPRLKADALALLRFGGWQGDLATWQTLTTDARRDVHEKVARGFEAYLFEGKAPTSTLRSAFGTFRAWLLGVYQTVLRLNVQLTPEVRGVFDRLIASDAAIAQAEQEAAVQPMFLTAAQAGMSDAAFAPYQGAIAAASRKARETLDRKLLQEVRREQTARWEEDKEAIRNEVKANLYGLPAYRALAAMRSGTNPDGSPLMEGDATLPPMRLSRQLLVEKFGAERLRTLPRGIYSAAGGLDPDFVAEHFGFSSGDAMLRAVSAAPKLSDAVEQETQRRMIEQHGSLMLDGTLLEEAQAAVANDDREQILRMELRALARLRSLARPALREAAGQLRAERKERDYERRWFEAEAKLRIAFAEGRKQAEIDALAAEVAEFRAQARGGAAIIRAALPPAELVRSQAQARLAAMRVGDIQPQRFWAAARQAATRALEAAARQDFDAAILAKQQELMEVALYRAAMRTRETVDTRTRQAQALDTAASRARLGKAGATYQEQIDGLLDRYEFVRVPQRQLDRRASLRKWVAAIEGEGLPVDLPEAVLDDARRVNYRDLTVEEFMGVTDALQQIAHLARLKNRLLAAKQQRELAAVTATLAQSIREQHAGRPRAAVVGDRRPTEEAWRTVADFFAGHRKLSNILRDLDGYQDGGAAWEAILRPLNDAGDREAVMMADATAAFGELVERAFPGRQKRTLYQPVEIKAIGKSLSRMQTIMVALNWGNADNRQRVQDGLGWTPEQVQAILDTLSPSDLAFVQGVFDWIDGFWPQIEAKQRRVTGLAPEKVEAVPIKTRNGEIRGGYFPLKYDDRLSAGAIKALDLDAANLAKQAAYTNATTRRGHTEARLAVVKLPVRLDFGVIYEHATQVIHDLSHHEALIDVGRILGQTAVQDAIIETKGDLIYKQIRNAVRDVAFGAVPAVNGFERAVNHIRQGATVVGLGWNFTTAALQPLGLSNSMFQIGTKWVARGLLRWLRNPTTMGQTVEWITAVSPMMRLRGQTQQREINEIRQQIGVSTGRVSGWVDAALETVGDPVTRHGIADSYFWMIQQMQRVADVPTWLGAYEKAMDRGEHEDRAIALADQAVLDSQGGGQIKDLSQVQRGGPMMKLWTNFYSFFNVLHQQHREAHGRAAREANYAVKVGRLGADYLMLFVVPATLGYLLRNGLRPGDNDDDDANLWAVILGENAAYLAGTMLGLREISGAIQGSYGYEGPAGARAFATFSRLAQQVKQGELDAALYRATLESAGILLHFPAAQIRRTLEGMMALAEGKTLNPMALLTGPPRQR
jgi:hypothetical protein